MAKNLMIQGTMSNAGKSIVTAGILRILRQDGFRAAPFKSQNMALNSFITSEGLEMGRAQVMQAEAAGIPPEVQMNPILLKPTSDVGSQVIVNGQVLKNMTAREYFAMKKKLVPDIMRAYRYLEERFDYIVIEGAGSPAEINLKKEDIVNMGMAKMADAPVLLVGDIDRGGVFAQLAGTVMLLEPEERARIKGLIINKFRGDKTILDPGIKMLEDICHIPVAGVLPYTLLEIDDEDSLSERLDRRDKQAAVHIAVVKLPHISNFTDFNTFERFPGVSVFYTDSAKALEKADMILIPGTKNTMGDLLWMRQNGMEAMVKKCWHAGVFVMGICGGYQMMGQEIWDEYGVEHGGRMSGMGMLPVKTAFAQEKIRTRVSGQICIRQGAFSVLSGAEISGYEIHMGRTVREDGKIFARIREERPHSTWQEDGCVYGHAIGTYIHGIFDSADMQEAVIRYLYEKKGLELTVGTEDASAFKERQYDMLADMMRQHMDMDKIYQIMEAK